MLKHYQREQLIWEHQCSVYKKMLLLALNSFVDANGECWPGQELLARMCGFSDRKIRNLCKDLENEGVIQRVQRRGKHGQRTSDKYKIRFDLLDQPAPCSGSQPAPCSGSQPAPCSGSQNRRNSFSERGVVVFSEKNQPEHRSRDLSSNPDIGSIHTPPTPSVGIEATQIDPENERGLATLTPDLSDQVGIADPVTDPELSATPDQRIEEQKNLGQATRRVKSLAPPPPSPGGIDDPFLANGQAAEMRRRIWRNGRNDWDVSVLRVWAKLWEANGRTPGEQFLNLKNFIRRRLSPMHADHGCLLDEWAVVSARLEAARTPQPAIAAPIEPEFDESYQKPWEKEGLTLRAWLYRLREKTAPEMAV